MACTACLVCLISSVSGRQQKIEEKRPNCGASNKHITKLKQSVHKISIVLPQIIVQFVKNAYCPITLKIVFVDSEKG
jgi:hypothetical protein